MAETDSYTKHYQLLKQQNQTNPNKYNTSFLYKKAVVIIIFLVIIPVFPSQAPEFINQTLLKHSWELLRLLFFGIAVSYGLFSLRNDETDKEPNNQSMFDNVQCFVSRFLQASSFFDDEAENMSGSDESKVQIWSSQYYRNELPTVLVAKKKGDDEIEKPLLLPVRSLKSSRVMEVHNGENNVVLPSLIPWRSRDGDIVKNKTSYRSPSPPPPPPPLLKQRDYVDGEIEHGMETSDDDNDGTESEDEDEIVGKTCIVSSTNNGENNAEAVGPNNGIDGGSDVDKKADEFIAKVREQIRLQMIDSIKR
ncbi:hypothetical protein E1A91_A03G014200v1 [Gossypium mustelinum]|uniref:DUF4408 domain-containing protein n=1 Tax=Gossypium mustelinum TaxID=34275 RepID=A0A5D2ZTB3_GOSMU|nr:hypothetical protein E1A91_A03G014200v1 [Gossypium mustelinum]